MRRSASEIIRNLEMRVARLERQSRRKETPQALVELGRRGRDHVNTQIFEWLGSYGDDYKQYVAVDVEDQVEFFNGGYGAWTEFNCELEYIDMHTNRESKEKKRFYLPLDERKIKQNQGVFDEKSILKNILSRDSSDIEELP